MKKKGFRFPSATVILLITIFLVTILTYLIPGGTFVPTIDPETGAETITLEGFQFQDSTPVSFLTIPLRIVEAFASGSTANIVMTYLFMGGGIHILTTSGAFQALAGTLMKKLNGKRLIMVAGFTTLFSICNIVLSPHSFVAFVPFAIMFARAMGYDAMVGVAMPLLGGAVAFSTGALLATTMTAQTLVGLPIFSGAPFRFICQICLLIPTILYIYRYGESVRTGKRPSLVAELEANSTDSSDDFDQKMSPRHILIMILFVATMVLVVYGSSKLSWSNMHIAAAFMVLGVVIGLITGNSLEKTIQMYIVGSKSMVGAAVLAGLAGAAVGILSSGGIMHTVVYYASNLILKVPPFLYAPMMFTMHILINCVIVSGGGQAAATMPIMGPIATLCGIPMQSAVLCFNFGDGLGNYILPHSNQLVSYLEAGKVGFGQWMAFMGKLFAIWMVIAWILSAVSTFVWG